MTYPWEKKEGNGHAAPLVDFDPLMFVRLRIQHGDEFRLVGIRADDKDITGRIKLDDNTEILISIWGVPTKSEEFMTTTQIMQEIIKYTNEKGLRIRRPA
jgi:hypothetical protein